MAFVDIPVRQNGLDHIIEAAWFNTIRTELINAFGTGGYIKEMALQTVTASGEITLDPTAFKPLAPVQGDGGAITTSTTPFGTSHGFAGGKEIILLGYSDANTVTIPVSDIPGGVISRGKIVLSRFEQVILIYNQALDRFIRKE